MIKSKTKIILLSSIIGIAWGTPMLSMDAFRPIPITGVGAQQANSIKTGFVELQKRASTGDEVAKHFLQTMPKTNLPQQKAIIETYNKEKPLVIRSQEIAKATGIVLKSSSGSNMAGAFADLTMAARIKNINESGYKPPQKFNQPLLIAGYGDIYAQHAYKELEERANGGDKLAEAIFKTYGTYLLKNPQLADTAVKEYNRQRTLLSPIPAPPAGGISQDYVNTLLEEIKRLKARIAELEVGGGPAATNQIQAIYDKFKAYLEDPSKVPSYRGGSPNIKDFLDELLAESKNDQAIAGFMDIIASVMGNTADASRKREIFQAYADLNQDSSLKEYNLNLVKKQVKDTENGIIFPAGEDIIKRLPPNPDAALLKKHPLFMLVYTDKSKGGEYWQKEQMPIYLKLAKSATLDELMVAYTVLVKNWKVRFNPEDLKSSEMQSFLNICYERILNKTPSSSSGLTPQFINEFIDKRIHVDLKIDFAQREKEALSQCQREYDSIMADIKNKEASNPLLKVLGYTLDQWRSRGFSRADYDTFIALFEYCETDELKAIFYHVSNIHLATQSPSSDNLFFYASLSNAINLRTAKTIVSKITGIQKSLMSRLISPPSAIAPMSSKKPAAVVPPPAVGGAGVPPPPPPPPAPPPPPLLGVPGALSAPGIGGGAPKVPFAPGSEAEQVQNALMGQGVSADIAYEAAASIYNSAEDKAKKRAKVIKILESKKVANVHNAITYRNLLNGILK